MSLREAVRRLLLRAIFGWDRLRLAWLRWLVPGLEIHPSATPAFASARYVIEPGGKLRIGARAATERRPGALSILVHAGGEMWRPLVDVLDVAMAHVVAADAPAEKVTGRVFNVVQENYKIKDLAQTVACAVKPIVGEIDIVSVPATGRKRDYRTSNRRLTEATGWTPSRTVRDSVDSVLTNVGEEVDNQEMLHPKYYNLRWMQLLTEVHEWQKQYSRVF